MKSDQEDVNRRRDLGVHLTPEDIFQRYIYPMISDKLYHYAWMDLFCGEGNLILPILNYIPYEDRVPFFSKHIFMFDIQEEMIERAVKRSKEYGIPEDIASRNIRKNDSLANYPKIESDFPPFHITNPPYLYIGYIAKRKVERLMRYFNSENSGLQDLYQIALANDLRNGIERMIYILPTNFIFSEAGSNFARRMILSSYTIKEALLFERRIFHHTGMNVGIFHFSRITGNNDNIDFRARKIGTNERSITYSLKKSNDYRAGAGFDDYVRSHRREGNFDAGFYLHYEDLLMNSGENEVLLVNSKEYDGRTYRVERFLVNEWMYSRIMNNPLFVRTIDSGRWDGRAGLYPVRDFFDADGVYVRGQTYRTNPIQIFLRPEIDAKMALKLGKVFNERLEMLRASLDSDFMTTYKYTDSSPYVRKYLGLKHVRNLINTISPADLEGHE
ncbi:methyltransferase [Thermoplasma sp. Kam2015]|uniref:Eco57I restriction-modification methylase domain-containing protein n=1 Tax=Thermoplasma sp. Kam2015 TaxID=2094122 RepID=UPI000D8EA6DB|nr:SAM-dependent DNA methyltransferase [Thermoplasma sp. Kam2015]PYB68845.1 methyltransferase [Thermoplasma sp. Kam2015]